MEYKEALSLANKLTGSLIELGFGKGNSLKEFIGYMNDLSIVNVIFGSTNLSMDTTLQVQKIMVHLKKENLRDPPNLLTISKIQSKQKFA